MKAMAENPPVFHWQVFILLCYLCCSCGASHGVLYCRLACRSTTTRSWMARLQLECVDRVVLVVVLCVVLFVLVFGCCIDGWRKARAHERVHW